MGISKTSDNIQVKIKMPNSNQEPRASSKAQSQDLEDMDLLCNYKIKIESQYSKPGISKTSVHIQFKIKMKKPSQEPPASSNAQ